MSAAANETFVYTVDGSWSQRSQRSPVNEEPYYQTKWHRCRDDDEALARCSRSIILNVEDKSRTTDAWVGPLCKKCFR